MVTWNKDDPKNRLKHAPGYDDINIATQTIGVLNNKIAELTRIIEKVNKLVLSFDGSNGAELTDTIALMLTEDYYSPKWEAELAKTTDI
jgi:hypothetical protein